MILIYSQKSTHRLQYIFNLIFGDILGADFRITTSIDEFDTFSGTKLNYSAQRRGDEIFFQSRNLLFENGISDQNVSVSEWKGNKVFFITGQHSILPFDPFAASFYLVSRYEEYLPHLRDMYNRFDAKESLAYQNNFLQKPLINNWAALIKEIILDKYPGTVFRNKKYQFISTIDIDNAYAYKEKGFMRSLGGYGRALTKLDVREIIERTQVLAGVRKDPYDTYDYQLEMQKKYNLNTIYFFLLGDYGVNDKNLPAGSKKFQSLIKRIGDYAQVGIHPSFGSNTKPQQLKKEIDRLSKILHKDVSKSRQHFLKLTLPHTYRNLLELDITDDYTMGYAHAPGFRASICSPFNFYDLDNEMETKLKVHPFAFMEGTFKHYMKIPPEEVMRHARPLIEEVKSVKGTLISLWHNESLSNEKEWRGWRKVFEEIVQEAL